MADASELKRVAFSPGEFAQLFGKSQTWGYRQISGGKVKAITKHGCILVPAAEVEAILKTVGVYNGQPEVVKSKAKIQSLSPRLHGAWQNFLAARRQACQSEAPRRTKGERGWMATSGHHRSYSQRSCLTSLPTSFNRCKNRCNTGFSSLASVRSFRSRSNNALASGIIGTHRGFPFLVTRR